MISNPFLAPSRRRPRRPGKRIALACVSLAALLTGLCENTALSQTPSGDGSGFVPPSPAPAAAVPTEPTAEDSLRLADRMETWFGDLKHELDELPRDTFDAQAVVDKVGRDPQKLLEWVRDKTSLVPYLGSLRGPAGVLMDRLGNSLDRALLLCELLRLAGHEARLARGPLTEEEAQTLLSRAKPLQPSGDALPRTAEPLQDERLEKDAPRYGMEKAKLRELLDASRLRAQQQSEQTARRAAEQTEAITAALGTLPAPGKDERAAIAALQDHWWVQFKDAAAWTDLDPAASGEASGRGSTEAKETFSADQLPEALLHLVDLQVVLERWQAGRFEEILVLRHTLRPSALFESRVRLAFSPLHWPAELNLPAEADPQGKLMQTLVEQHEWVPVLVIGSEQIFQSGFSDSGLLIERSQIVSPVGAAATGATQDSTSLLDMREDPVAPAASAAPDSMLSAVWVDYTIRVPGRPARTVRREVLDLRGPAARNSGSLARPELSDSVRQARAVWLARETEVLCLAGWPSLESVRSMLIRNLLEQREGILGLLRGSALGDVQALGQHFQSLDPLPGGLYALATLRRGLGRPGSELYLDGPNLFTFSTRFALDPQGRLEGRRAVDIVVNEVAVRPGSGSDAFRARLEQGVMDTNAETMVLSDRSTGGNTAELFARSAAEGTGWVLVRSASDPAWPEIRLAPDVRARIEQDLSAGYAVLVPRAPIHVDGREAAGWWRIDLSSGQTLGMTDSGDGGAMSEYMGLIRFVVGAFITEASYIGCVGKTAGGGSGGSGTSSGKLLGCAVCAAVAGVVGALDLKSGAELGASAIGGGCSLFGAYAQ